MATVIDTAVAWACMIANSADHGYDQENRWGPDYDCSSLIITAYEVAGVPVKTTYGATRTANMYTPFIKAGFVDITSAVDINTGAGTRKGDVWLTPANHVAMMADSANMVEANYNELLTATGGETGDQRAGETVEEIGIRPWHKLKTAAWKYVLRYPGGTDGVAVDKTLVTSGNFHLTTAQCTTNGMYIAAYMLRAGWTLNAVCGMLGNMQYESGCNPGIWESLDEGNTSGGFGLVQWTPATNLINWANNLGYDYTDIDTQLMRIIYEVENKLQYYARDDYPEPATFEAFTQSTLDPYTLGCVFAWNYERSYTILYGTEAEKEQVRQQRGGAADTWYKLLSGMDLILGAGKRKGISNILFFAMATE